ncbi:MAG: 30S ribosomal protein S20 [Bacillota bacterium]
MANIKSAIKRAKQAEKRRLRNKAWKSRAKTAIKAFLASLETKDREKITQKFREAMSLVDRLVTKGVIHRNAADRRKSRLSKLLNKALSASA